MKERIEKVLVLALVLCLGLMVVSAFGQDRECKAPNAIWLKPSNISIWIYYELTNIPDGYVLRLVAFDENIKIYTAHLGTEKNFWGSIIRQNVVNLSKNEIWLCRFDSNYPYNYTSYWHKLEKQDPDNLLLNKYLRQTIYIDTGNGVWYSINVFGGNTEGSDVIPWTGLLKANVYWSFTENDIYPCTCADEN